MNNNLLQDLKCTSCNNLTPKLSKNEIKKNLKQLINWSINDENEMIFKKYKFKNFKKAIDFANSVGQISDEERHHPDLSIGFGYCIVMIHTHAIKALSINDFILASKIDSLSI